MIKTFADKATELLFCEGNAKGIPRSVWARAVRKLDMVDNAMDVTDLRVPPGNRLRAFQGDKVGYYSISINDQWRIVFRFEGEDAYDVAICDYH